jgi:hypothetical protein
MKVPSTLLYVFSKMAGTQVPDDSVLDVPHSILPVANIPTPVLKIFSIPDDVNDQAQSFMYSGGLSVTNGAGGASNQVRMDLGLWHFNVNIDAVWTAVPTTGFFCQLQGLTTGSAFNLCAFTPSTVGQFGRVLDFNLAIFAEKMRFVLNVPAAAVGQTNTIQVGVLAQRLA